MPILVNLVLDIAPAPINDLSASLAFENFSSWDPVLNDLNIFWV